MKEIDLTLPMAKVTIKQMVFKPITMALAQPIRCNHCGQVRKAGGFIAHFPLLEGDDVNTIYFYMCTKSCLNQFKKTDKINLKIRDVMLKAYNALRERSKEQ